MNTPPLTLWLQWHGDAEPDDTEDVARIGETLNQTRLSQD